MTNDRHPNSFLKSAELETQLLSLDATQKRRIIQLLTQSIHSPTPPSPSSMMTLGMFRGPNQSVEGDFTIAEFHGDTDAKPTHH